MTALLKVYEGGVGIHFPTRAWAEAYRSSSAEWSLARYFKSILAQHPLDAPCLERERRLAKVSSLVAEWYGQLTPYLQLEKEGLCPLPQLPSGADCERMALLFELSVEVDFLRGCGVESPAIEDLNLRLWYARIQSRGLIFEAAGWKDAEWSPLEDEEENFRRLKELLTERGPILCRGAFYSMESRTIAIIKLKQSAAKGTRVSYINPLSSRGYCIHSMNLSAFLERMELFLVGASRIYAAVLPGLVIKPFMKQSMPHPMASSSNNSV